MKTTTRSITVALLTVAIAGSAFANGQRGHYPHNQHRGHHHARHHDSNWVAPLLFLGLAGAVIGAAASQRPSAPQPIYYVEPPVTYVQPAPVYVAPPVSIAPPAPQPTHAWYFCRSAGQYYPYTQSCPEGWQLVSPTPQQ
jgi:hypothetical protein